MGYTVTDTDFCHTPGCLGAHGVAVRVWVPGPHDLDPPEVDTDACPYCGNEIHQDPLDYEDAIDAMLDELHLTASEDLDRLAVARVIRQEIERQRTAADGR